ncbi:MAG TPA: hypothetical protein VMY34_08610 [Acidimicrobiales bacterium]|nr:hypothetical protein [Acidimicrobiales bacterium]
MKRRLFLLCGTAAFTASFIGSVGARADVGGGACAFGTGFGVSIPDPTTNVYVGVNVGENSETGVFDNQTDYETQCCAETGQEPDCFDPIQ